MPGLSYGLANTFARYSEAICILRAFYRPSTLSGRRFRLQSSAAPLLRARNSHT